MLACCYCAIWKQATVSQSVKNEACIRMSACCHCAVWKQASVIQSVRQQPVSICHCVVMVQSGYKPLLVSQSESSLYVHVNLLSQCSLETSHCQSVTEQHVCICQSVVVVQSGNEPLPVSPSKMKPVCMSACFYCAVWKRATVSQSVKNEACIRMSACCHCAVWKRATVSPLESSLCVHVSLLPWCSLETSHCQSVREQPVCTCQSVAMVQSGNKPLSANGGHLWYWSP